MGRNHVRVVAGHPETRLAAVADTDAEAVASVTAQTGAVGFTDPMAMIAESELDGIIIAAPTTFHGPLAHAAIERGVPVLVEKPLAATHAEALAIVAAGRAAGVPVQVGHPARRGCSTSTG
jgi:UDP-N-acetylglucosamine 3-dehydrogenase